MESRLIAQKVVGEYVRIGTVNCCSFGLYSNDGSYTYFKERYVCHAGLRDQPADTFDQLITSYPTDDVLFFYFMRNVLYKNWSEQIHLETEPKSGLHYIRVSDLSKIPANVLYNFCICSRMPVEYPAAIQKWEKWVLKDGIHPSIALALCRSVPVSEIVVVIPYGHSPIDVKVSLKRLVQGDPYKLSKGSYKTYPDLCTPTNCIWGSTLDLKEAVGASVKGFWLEWKEKNEEILQSS